MARILVVEDNPANMKLTTFLLQSAGHVVLMAIDAEAGLTIARSELPDLILMDIQLPGMDGLAATLLLKRDERTRKIPVIALTALAMKGDEVRIRTAGCDGYIAKPMRYQDVLATVALFLVHSEPAADRPASVREGLPAISALNPCVLTPCVSCPLVPPLPLAPTESVARAARILIVDDEADNRELLEIILKWAGFETISATNGEEALAMSISEKPNLVLLDIMMPEMSGYEVTKRLKGESATMHIPIVIVSAMNDRASKMRALNVGAADYITKPFDRLELCKRVRKLLRHEAV